MRGAVWFDPHLSADISYSDLVVAADFVRRYGAPCATDDLIERFRIPDGCCIGVLAATACVRRWQANGRYDLSIALPARVPFLAGLGSVALDPPARRRAPH
jgi:hypothetical protein